MDKARGAAAGGRGEKAVGRRPKSIILADDHSIFRKGLKMIIEEDTAHTVVGEASDGNECIILARRHRPDMVIMDIGLPALNGLSASREILRILPSTRIIIFSIHRDKSLVSEAIRVGISGYLLKEGSQAEIVEAIDRVFKGYRYFSPALSDVVAEIILSIGPPSIETGELAKLSLREMQVLSMSLSGASKAEIARKLHISTETVKTHRVHIKEKLKLKRLDDLERLAVDQYLRHMS